MVDTRIIDNGEAPKSQTLDEFTKHLKHAASCWLSQSGRGDIIRQMKIHGETINITTGDLGLAAKTLDSQDFKITMLREQVENLGGEPKY